MREFEHGGNILAFAKANGYRVDEVIDLSSNINFIKPKLDIDFNKLNTSPYPSYKKLYKRVAKYYGVHSQNLELFNGATVAIDNLLGTLKRDRAICTIYSPAYLEYKRVAKKYGYKIVLINRLDSISPPPKNSVVIFVNPSTPDGVFYDLEEFLCICKEQNSKVIIDESFLDFYSLKHSATRYLGEFDNLFIIKSMSKYFGSAGVRVGAIISSESFISSLKFSLPLWRLSSFDMEYTLSSLRDKSLKVRSKEANRASKRYLKRALGESSLIDEIYPSRANFILVKSKISAKEFQKILTPHKIMIRECSNFDFLSKYHLRVAIKDLDSLKVFKDAIDG